ncbi:hypothetical protein [Achromobacter sp.]|uniref:hypothetical protein n=1 Tax=Achromobacter sp. TaxID=134375 RepID=UPI0028B1AB48|nr:hypothetical protein [Achromobacter sp.]
MPKTTTLADKQALLAKMERDRQALARPAPLSKPTSSLSAAGAAWARTTALAAGAAIGWPPFLRQPLRAMAAVALRDRFSELLTRSQVRRVSGPLHNPDLARLAKSIEDVREAAARSASEREIEQLRLQLDEQVRRLRALREPRSATPGVAAPQSATPGVAAPRSATPAVAVPGSATPAVAVPGSATPAVAAPRNAAPTVIP